MIIYADTSALVKLFVAELHSDMTRRALKTAQALGTGLLTRVLNLARRLQEARTEVPFPQTKHKKLDNDYNLFGPHGYTLKSTKPSLCMPSH